jgi:serine protease AprX
VGESLTHRDGFRLRAWQLGLVTLVFAMAFGMIRAGASWGSSTYDPTSDPYSLQNVMAGDGVQQWWKAGDTGQGVDVALIDTGVAPVPALSGNNKLLNGPDLSFESQDPSTQYLDTNGHGTFMAGIIGGNDEQPGGYRGVAPDSRILSVKVGTATGAVDVSQVIAAIDWVVQHRYDNGMNIRVINLSYGTSSLQPYTVDPLAFAAEQAWKAGIVVVTAAGNTGLASSLSDPAYDPWLISVGAADTMGTPSLDDDQPAPFSASPSGCHPKTCRAPDLLAPGTHVQGLRVPGSYVDQNNPGSALGSLYFRGSGTSEAAAYVTGAVALLLQKYPDLTPDEVKFLLTDSATRLSGVSRRVQGSGELNLTALARESDPNGPGWFRGGTYSDDGTNLAVPSGATVGRNTVGRNRKFQRNGTSGPQSPPDPAAPPTPAGPDAQNFQWSTGTGSLELSRGGMHLINNGVLLQGEQDIFGQPFDSVAMAGLEANDNSWSGGIWNGSSWSGSSWSGNSWSGSSWSGSSWSGSSWSGSSWSGNSWNGSSWSGSSWSGSSWSGSSWSGSSWSGDGWLGASWG